MSEQPASAWGEPERATRLLSRLAEETGLAPAETRELTGLCLRSADPDFALAGAVRALGARRRRFGGPARRSVLGPLVTLCAGSRFLAAHLAAQPRLLDLLSAAEFVERPARLLRLSLARDAVDLARRLRRFKLREVLRIALRDLSGDAGVPEVTHHLSRVASLSFGAAVDFHYAQLCAQHGPPEGRSSWGASGFCVLGMGKLGGDELNFSSDVDVVYLYDRDGRTQGLGAAQVPLTHFAFYARLAEEVTQAVGGAQATPEGGFVFRVDLDLRPEGRSGPIVNSQRALELYYEAQGAGWERFALLKARPVAGDLAVGEEALLRLTPFVFRKYLDLGAVDELRALKLRSEREANRRGVVDLKLGPGGIREVEFFVQALQLLHGGRDPNLRVRGTLRALDRLLYAGLISSRDRDELSEAYLLLRRLEHRVQMVAERQTHAMPSEPLERERLARRTGFADAEALEQALDQHRAKVGSRFRDLLRVAGGGQAKEDARAAVAADPGATEPERTQALALLGFYAPEASAAELLRLSRKRGTPFHPDASAELQQGALALVAELAAAPDPDQALRHLADLFGALANPRLTAELLVHSPRTARLLLSLFGSSDFLSRSLLRHPELIDQLVHRGAAPLVRGRSELRDELSRRLGPLPLKKLDVEEALGEVRRFRNEEVLRLGLHDVSGALQTEEVFWQLSDLAEVCVEVCVGFARAEAERRDGAASASLCVVALGKLGGRELGYHSDLDLLFLYSGPGETKGPRPATHHEHFARQAQKLISHLTVQLPDGALYRIDTRLRPSGSEGPLVVSFEALASYHQRGARLWERQALLRARPIAGDFALFEKAQREVLHPSLFKPQDEAERREAAREIAAMRERMQREIADETPARYNSKQGRGGLVDVEFAVQLLQLAHGSSQPAVRSPSTPAALSALRELGLLAPSEHDPLAHGYRFLRKLESRLRIGRDRSVDHLPRSGRELELLARRLGYSGPLSGQTLLADYQRTTEAVRAAFLRVVAA